MQLRLTLNEKEIAAKLAHASDNEQAAFFQTFMKELRSCCETQFKVQTQLAYIAGMLTPADREDLAMLGPEAK